MLHTEIRPNPESQECDHNETTEFNNQVWCLQCGEYLGSVESEFNVQEIKAEFVDDDTEHVCSWCHFTFDNEGKRKRYLTDVEYNSLSVNSGQSHGICRECATNAINDARAQANELNYEHNSVNL